MDIPCYVFSGSPSGSGGGLSLAFVLALVTLCSGTSLAPRFAGFTVPARPTRDNRNGRLLYPVWAARCPGLLGRRLVCDARRSCCRSLYREGEIVDLFLLLAPDAMVTGVLALGHRTVCFVSLELCALVLLLRIFFGRTCCHPGGRVLVWRLRSPLRGYCFGAVVPWFLATFSRSCGWRSRSWVARSCSPGHLTASDLVTGPRTMLPRPSPPVCRLPMGWPGWGFVYVSTLLDCCLSYFLEILDFNSCGFLVRSCGNV